MKWDEFKDRMIGIGPDTALGRIVQIRSEDDPEVLKHFTKEQHKIRNEWLARKAKNLSKEQMDDMLEQLKKAFISMAGGI